jgi:3,4-dihydroxy 2-butanone 4-phosphate synthase/GTP cyclohydrolase II
VSGAHPERPPGLSRVARAKLPTANGLFMVHAYIDDDGEHLALVHGDPEADRARPVPVRLHSACITGDVFASLKCDCGQQLEAAIDRITTAGAGVVLYLDQEGRGIGLANKMRAYEQQDAGLDTVDANTVLGFEADQRDYGVAARILDDLGIGHVELLTNNPRKAAALRAHGVTVDRVPLEIEANTYNRRYLATKAARLGHQLDEPGEA